MSLNSTSFAPHALAGKRALVTGAGRGIGRQVALTLAASSCELVLLGRNQSRLAAVAAELQILTGKTAPVFSVDVGDNVALEATLASVAASGSIDILINNAGIYLTEAVAGHSLESWNKTMETNLTSALITARAFLPGMMAQRWGRVVNVSSISGKHAEPYGAAYSVSKFGLIGLTQAMALECASAGVTVNAVCPGWVATDMAYEQISDPHWCEMNGIESEQSLEITRLSVPQQRLIEPVEVASLIVYLCTLEAAAITGQAINICGGLSIQ